MGLEILERHVARVEGFPVEIKNMLQHFIVSHHGEIDRGALRRPASPKAIVLHYLDEVDARLEQAWRLIDQGPPAEEWTAYVPFAGATTLPLVPSGDELDPCPPTNGARFIASSTEAKLSAPVEDNGHC